MFKRSARPAPSLPLPLRAEGVLFDDSTKMAEAVKALEPVRFFYPTTYAHANYYYGRLLRNHGNHPAAMQAFLRTVHSRTKDHEIKGRAYSNMGTMSHSVGEFALSYDMYERSATHFMLTRDTIAYTYARDAMAIELAELSMHDETLALIDGIVQECTYWPVVAKAYEAQAILYFNMEQYDSVLYSVDQLQAYGNHEPTGYVKKAQAFWCLANYDSALVYAKQVMDMPNASPRDQYNMLYILAYNDSTIDSEQIRQLSEERSDVDRYIIDPWLTQLTQATELLKIDISKKPDLRWLYAVILTLAILGLVLLVFVKRKRKKHQLISQQTEEILRANEKLFGELEDMQAMHDTLSIQTQQLEQQQKQLKEKLSIDINLFRKTITKENINEALCWKDFNRMCTIVNQRMNGLADKLKAKNLTAEQEIRLCILVAIGVFDTQEMASLIPYGYDSFKTQKSRIAKRLSFEGRNMQKYLLKMALEE